MITNQEIRDTLISNGLSYKKATNVLSDKYPDINIYSLRSRCKTQEIKLKKSGKASTGKKSLEEHKDKCVYSYSGDESINSLEDAIEFFQIDIDKWEVDKWHCNSWDVNMKNKEGKPISRTNYQVKVFLKKRVKTSEEVYKETLDYALKYVKAKPRPSKKTSKGSGVGVAAIADMHIGAKSDKRKGLILTKDFNLQVVTDYLDEIAEEINSKGKKKVYLAILGDLIESLTGLNHVNSWQSMEEDMHHGNVIIVAYELLDQFVSKIHNLEEIEIVGGNHDRGTERNDQDTSGTAAQIISYMLSQKHKVNYHRMIITKVIDGVCYLLTHGHWKFSNRPLSEVFFDYGKQGMYNVMLKGHLHIRDAKKAQSTSTVEVDKVGYRSINVASLFTGNFYSESLGFTSSSGFSWLEASRTKRNVRHEDIPIG